MKKNKKFKNEEPVETFITEHEPGTVGEFIDLLQTMPADYKFTLNGCAHIGELDNPLTIYPREAFEKDVPEITSEDIYDLYHEKNTNTCDECSSDIATDVQDQIATHVLGIATNNPDFLEVIRQMPADHMMASPVMCPNPEEAEMISMLHPNQQLCLAEIRHHNAYVAECLGEMHRREIAALLEYNTQCLAHFGFDTNRVMCQIVAMDEAINKEV